MNKNFIKIVLFAVLIAAISGCAQPPAEDANTTEESSKQIKLKIFHAGSLAVPLSELEDKFEALHPNVDVQRESMGSVKAVRQITDIGKKGDVIASADYTLIPSMMYPTYADWTVRFARNDMVLAYSTEKSKYADQINPENWYDILRKDDVVYGFSNPNFDPCGYRAVMVFQLAELNYGDDTIFDDLILSQTSITINEEDGSYLIKTPEDMKPNTKRVSIRPKSVELVALLEQGGIDYAFEYRSVAVQHDLGFVDLPEKIDLSNVKYADFYKKVQLETVDGKTKTGKPIVYGISVPKNAPHPELGLEFVKFVIGTKGQEVFKKVGQPPIVPAVGSGNLPGTLQGLVADKPSSLMVYSGAGMRKPMDEIGSLFEQKHGVSVNYNYGGSNTLLSQIELIKTGDAYMPGATMYIEKAREKGFVDYEQNIAYHVPVIAVPEGNPAGVTCLNDLTKPGVKVVLGDAKAAACGKIADKILEKNEIFDAVNANVIARSATVNELVVYTCMGTTDASIIWQASLIGTEDETDIIEIPTEQNIIKVIPVGALTFSENKDYAKVFVDFVSSDEGKAVFEKHGFTAYPNPKYE
ncbi:MAG: Bacterial extracellular solute-binding protein [Candidatus Argoarchaeum ethanivorans]|uniref:Bacterial extracellular solute-binding protein n=1 Tax=Candidatus Argoarchaeum ethanivorans TaxID=2608793 RepID=A0A811TH98_9EURY|nr:MAG: Bacterial extracellular solute-binding protein [Candidatus Argoarchaeum ethanivorans]